MSYNTRTKISRSLGYQSWGVNNPWVFADLSQPQRKRGQISPAIFKTHPLRFENRTLPPDPNIRVRAYSVGFSGMGDTATDQMLASALRMETYAVWGLAISVASLAAFMYQCRPHKAVHANRRRRRRR